MHKSTLMSKLTLYDTIHGLHQVGTGSDLLITRVSYCLLTIDDVFIISKNIKIILPVCPENFWVIYLYEWWFKGS